jgi:hypothetical protein
MNEAPSRVLNYLDYKNKTKTAEWEERLWQQHLNGAPTDFRADEDRQRYLDLLNRVEQSRSLARKLHTRRTAHAPRFGVVAAQHA